jgi:hypothetical protein
MDSDYTPLVSSIMSRLESISVNELYAQALGFESRQAMVHETDQHYMTSANLAMRGRGRGRGSNNRGGRFGSTEGRSFSGRGRGCGWYSSQKRINQDVKSARNQIMKLQTVGTYLMKTTKLRKGMLLLLCLHMVLTQIATRIQELQTMSWVS